MTMTREEAINRFKGIRESFSISIAQSKFYPSKDIQDELCDIAIKSLQTDIVRCKDCQWYKKIVEKSKIGVCHYDLLVARCVYDEDYCSHGGRREP